MIWTAKKILLVIAVICFLIATVISTGVINIDAKISWVDLGLFFGFLSFLWP